jgi:hypothetical protein
LLKRKGVDEREIRALQEEAATFEAHGKYTDAAACYMQAAIAYLDQNELIYAHYSR